MAEDKTISDEVNDIVAQEGTQIPATQEHAHKVHEHGISERKDQTKNEHSRTDNHTHPPADSSVHHHKNDSTHQSHSHHSNSQTSHDRKESKFSNFWNIAKSQSTEKKSFKERAWDSRVIIIILIIIFLLAFGIRGHLLQYTYLFEFDAFYHARLVEQIVTTGGIINPDPLAYYQIPNGAPAQQLEVYHLVSAWLYQLISLGQPYNKELLMWTIQFFPVIFGAIISILMYFLGKEVFNSKKIGLITAFVTAVTPAFAYRTMAGAQGDNSFGFIWFVLGFIFLVRATKTNGLEKKSLINAGLAGLMFGLMAMTWTMYLLIPLVVIAYFLFGIVLIATKEQSNPGGIKENHSFIFLIKIIITMAIFHVLSYAYGENWIADALGYVGQAVHLSADITLILMVIAGVALSALSILFISKSNKETKNIFKILVIIGLYASFFVLIFMFLTVPDLQDRSTIASMVGEESVGNSFFGTKYNELIVFPWIALILLPISIYLFKKDDSHTGIIFFFWVMITLFMAWYKLKFTFVFGLAIAPAVAITFYAIFEGLKKYRLDKGIEAKFLVGVLLILVLLGVGASAKFFPDYKPFVDENPNWQAAIEWINTNTPADAKLMNWWDQGHILSFLTDRKVSLDNRNYDGKENQIFSEFAITTDSNRGYEIAKTHFGADYIVLDSSMFQGITSFVYYYRDKVDYSSEEVTKYYNGPINLLSCGGTDSNSGAINCQGNEIPRDQWNKISTIWKETPDDFQNGSDPVFYYRSGTYLIVLNKAANESNLAKVWLNSSETSRYYQDVYNVGGIKIIKIIK